MSSNKNPFANLAAGQGWMTTKKRGINDNEIQRDRARAVLARKKRQNVKRSTGKSNKQDSQKDKSSLDGFVVDDSDQVSYEEASSEEEVSVTKPPKGRTSALFKEESSSSEESDTFLSQYNQNKKRTSRPMPKKAKHSKNVHVLESSSDEEEEEKKQETIHNVDSVLPCKSKYFSSRDTLVDTPQAPKPQGCQLDYGSDDAEARALEWAIQDSLKPSKRLQKKKKRMKKHKKQKTTLEKENNYSQPKVVIDLEDSLSEEEEEVEQDAYVDSEEAREAQSVLQAANELSARVVSTMTSWCTGNKNKSDDKNTVPQGMIVDGALAFNDMLHKSTTSASHSYITQEEIQRTCPSVKLANYQLVGVNWLALLHGMTYQTNLDKKMVVNGILADEMGLGKTVQTICFLAWLKTQPEAETGNHPHIIIVPASVLSNWQREFEKFCPDMNVIKYHGSMAERQEIQDELLSFRQKKTLDVVLTTFSYFSSTKSSDRAFLRRFRFDYMVIDEAHCLKNPKGTRYRNLDKFDTSHRLLLTGTPVQNSPKELMSLLCFLMPLFSRSTSQHDDYEGVQQDGGESMLQHFVSLESKGSSNKDAHATAYKKLKQLFAPFVLRRRKSDVLSQIMPPKERKLEMVPFDEQTRMLYDSILANHLNQRNGNKVDSSKQQQHLFTQLRKAANHPLLLRTRHTSHATTEELSRLMFDMGYFGRDATCTIQHVRKELETFSDFDVHIAALELMDQDPSRRRILEKYTLDQEDLFSSPKLVRLRTLLPRLIRKEGHRVLVFSQWTKCLDLLACLMDALGFEYLRLDGQTSISERQVLIDRFNQDDSIPIFLLSTRAGGLGINLTAADTCLLHDVDFNPFNDLQAEDRCHRLGQKKKVTVIKMVTEDTVDMDIYKMQQDKVQMNAAILESSTNNKTKETEEMNKIVENAMNRFLASPPLKKSGGSQEEAIVI